MRFSRIPIPFGRRVLIAFLAVAAGTSIPATAALAPGDCVDFEDLTPGTNYVIPATFSDSGVTVLTGPFQWSSGTWTSAGVAQVQTANLAGGLGNDMAVNNITLIFEFGRPVVDLRLLFADLGGNVNLTVNGDFRNELDLDALHGLWVGGTLVEVSTSATGKGVLRITGNVTDFSIGGQELWIDDLCDSLTAADCVEFEELPYPHSYGYGQFFVDSGVVVGLDEFFWLPSGSTTGGSCNVSNNQTSGGTGHDVNSDNINLHFDFGTAYGRLALLYADLGGNDNLWVNGVMANVANLSDLHLSSLGGALIAVQPPGANNGELIVQGAISHFGIGGQELWIDRVCITDRSLFSDDFEWGNSNAWAVSVP